MYMATLGANSNIIIKNDIRFRRTTTTRLAVFKVLPTRLHFLRHDRNSRGLVVCQCQHHHHKGKPDSSSNISRVSK